MEDNGQKINFPFFLPCLNINYIRTDREKGERGFGLESRDKRKVISLLPHIGWLQKEATLAEVFTSCSVRVSVRVGVSDLDICKGCFP